MDDLLQKLEDEIRRKEAEAAKVQTELAELATALRVLQRIRRDGNEDQIDAQDHDADADQPDEAITGTPPFESLPDDAESFIFISPNGPVEQDLAGSTILGAAVTILREQAERGNPNVHYKAVATVAKQRGYQGRSDKAMEQSFWAIMNRNSDTFKPMGQGRYTLKERFVKTGIPVNRQEVAKEMTPPTGVKKMVKIQRESLAGWSAQLLLDNGPLSLVDLTDRLEAMGKEGGAKNFRSTVNSALWRRYDDLFEKREDGLYHLRTKEIEFIDKGEKEEDTAESRP